MYPGANNRCKLVGTPDLINGTISADFTGAVAGIVSTNSADRSVNYTCSEGCIINTCSGYNNRGSCNQHLARTRDAQNLVCVTNCCPACLDNSGGVPNDPGCYYVSNDHGSGNEFGLLMTEWALYRAGVVPTCRAAQDSTTCGTLPDCMWSNAGGRQMGRV